MANLIKVKRSSSNLVGTSSPSAQLSNGELCWTEAGNVLFIGAYGGTNNFAIAGQRVPGVLTANQAIVTNSTNMVDQIMLGNSTINSVANGSAHLFSNSTATASYGQVGVNIGNSTANQISNSITTVIANSTANAVLTPVSIFLGNSTANTLANSIIVQVANSTALANLSPLSLWLGNSTVNAIINTSSIAFNSQPLSAYYALNTFGAL